MLIIIVLAALILGFAMANYSFVESSGELDNAIMIVKENSVVVDTHIVVIINLDPAGQTALNCKSVCRCFAHAKSFTPTVVDFSLGTVPISITFTPSEDTQSLPLEIIEDGVTEGNEVFTLTLSLASGTSNTIQIGQDTAQVTIVDDDSK